MLIWRRRNARLKAEAEAKTEKVEVAEQPKEEAKAKPAKVGRKRRS